VIDRFEIVAPGSPRPQAERIIFCDGTGGALFQAATDLELSHWRPNCTPAEYRADTSTEICFRFLDSPRPGQWTVAVNNHVDVDGILSVYVLVHSRHALDNRQTIVQAAELGDFWGWGEPAAQRLFQGLTLLFDDKRPAGEIYAEAFRRVPGLIDGSDPDSAAIDAALAPLRRGVELVEQGQIVRRPMSARLTQYIIPLEVAGDDGGPVSYVPEFNEQVSEAALLWPQVRARWDFEQVCLVCCERRGGWFHDLWFPGYLWADTAGLWRIRGVDYHDNMSHYTLDHRPLLAAFERLQQQERGAGQWALGGTASPLGDVLTGRFPLGGRFADASGASAASSLAPDAVAAALAGLFDA